MNSGDQLPRVMHRPAFRLGLQVPYPAKDMAQALLMGRRLEPVIGGEAVVDPTAKFCKSPAKKAEGR